MPQTYSILEDVYVIRIDTDIFVKRIQFNKFNATLRVDSDNTFYDTYTIKGDDLNNVEIIGKVICTLFSKVRRFSQPIQALAMEAH